MKVIKVVSAIIIDSNKNILSTQRGYGKYEGYWEFPGGKVEKNENDYEALKREIKEELEIEINIETFFKTIEYDYIDFHLTMNCYICSINRGKPILKEHKDSKWLNINELDTINWLEADKLLIKDLKSYLE